MAARAAGICQQIDALDCDEPAIAYALEHGIIDTQASGLEELVSADTLVVIATPVSLIADMVAKLWHQAQSKGLSSFYITDVGSVKRSAIELVRAEIGLSPSGFIPAHPIAGSEKNGVEHAQVDLLKNKKVILTPTDESAGEAVDLVTEFWQAMGAKTEQMSALLHDEIYAATSHLPHILSFAYVQQMHEMNRRCPVFDNVGSGFRDFTRIAASEPAVWSDILLSNKDVILPLIEDNIEHLKHITSLISTGNNTALIDYLAVVRDIRQQINGK
tara:strand:+ start:9560 stop:10378 length:819 start_codon:yes stop_codon:yes gene_type:complete